MFCTSCGNKNEEKSNFCIYCGTPMSSQASNTPAPKIEVDNSKSRSIKKMIPIIVGALALLIVAGGVTGYFLYQKHIDKQADNVMAYIDDNEYGPALELYKKYSGKKESFDNKVFKGIEIVLEQIKEDYMSEYTDYYLVQDILYALGEFDIMGLELAVYDVSLWVDKLNVSRENYHAAKSYYDKGDYNAALEKYGLVIIEDSKYYDLAVKDTNSILQEVAAKQRETEMQEVERISNIREGALADAEDFANGYYYRAAILEIEKALVMIPDDTELTERLALYNELYSLSLNVSAFDSSLYEYTYTEEDKEFMTLSIELPVLLGEIQSYEIINDFFEKVKEEYVNECNLMAEEARPNVDDEYFIPYSFGISYSVQYNNNGILCIVQDGHVYTGGAHGYPLRHTYTFDLSTGIIIELSDLISADDKVFSQYIIEEFQRMYNEAPEEYWPDSLTTVENNSLDINNLNYFITEDSIYIFYFPYDLGSYARGFVEIIIPYENNEWMFNYNFIQ